MIIVTLSIGNERYGIRVDRVLEITPLTSMKPIPMTEKYIAGMINYRGLPVPVVDLCQLLENRACSAMLSTRLILINIGDDQGASGRNQVLGLIAEKATETLVRREHEIISSGITVKNAPFLGGLIHTESGMIQLLDITRLLDQKVKDVIFAQAC